MTQSQRNRPRVLLVSAGVGAGHNQAARALQAGLNQADPSLEVQWLDVLTTASTPFNLYYMGGYNVLVSRLPWLYGFGYWLTDQPRGPRRTLTERRRLFSERISLRPFSRWLTERLPALVVNTHFLSQAMTSWMIGRQTPGLRQMTVITDFHAHRWWCATNVERYFVPDESGREKLLDFGTPAERIEIAGLPVHPKWYERLDEREIRGRWNLPAGKPVVLLAGGAFFTVGGIDEMALELCRRLPQAIIVVLAGNNKKLMGQLAALPQAQGSEAQLRIVSFTDRIHELVELATVYVTKSGGMTVTEAAVKGTPMVLLHPVPGQEANNAKTFVAAGAAVQADKGKQAVQLVAQIVADPAKRDALSANAKKLARPSTQIICQRILEAVDQRD